MSDEPFELLIDPRMFIAAQFDGISPAETMFVDVIREEPVVGPIVTKFVGFERRFLNDCHKLERVLEKAGSSEKPLLSLKEPVKALVDAHGAFLRMLETVVKCEGQDMLQGLCDCIVNTKDVLKSHERYIVSLLLVENFVNGYCVAASQPGDLVIRLFKLPFFWQRTVVERSQEVMKLVDASTAEKLEKFTRDCDNITASADSIPKLEQIGRMFLIEPFPIAVSGRRFIREGRAMKQCRKAVTERVILLFSDIFMYVQPKGGRYVVPASYVLMYLRVVPSTYDEKACLDVYAPKKSFILQFASEEERDSWNTSLQDAIENAKAHVQIPEYKEAPIWIPDIASNVCMGCGVALTFFRRKHHCRNCGRIMCSNCLPKRVLMPHISTSSLCKVCLKCYDEITNEAKHSPAEEEAPVTTDNEEDAPDFPSNCTPIQSVMSEEQEEDWSESSEEDHPDLIPPVFAADPEICQA